jgi:hypothetical protein
VRAIIGMVLENLVRNTLPKERKIKREQDGNNHERAEAERPNARKTEREREKGGTNQGGDKKGGSHDPKLRCSELHR